MTPVDTGTVRLERAYDASPDRVFAAWTNPEVLRRWWAISDSFAASEVEVDLRVGGRYRLAMRDADSGEGHVVFGEYREVDPPDRLVYTWAWEGTGPYAGHESVVSVRFQPEGDGTRVVLEHSGLLDDDSRASHTHGWTGVLEMLEQRGIHV